MKWTLNDVQNGLCTISQVGQLRPTPPQNAKDEVPSTTPEEFIGEWMAVYQAIGGRKALEEFAKANPIKFYDQLMKLLVSMEAPKQVMELHLGRGTLSEHELESLSTLELKKRLLASVTEGNLTIPGEFRET